MTEPAPEELCKRFARRLVEAWPEGELSEAEVREVSSLTLDVDDNGRVLVISALGYTSYQSFDDDDDLGTIVDQVADHIAYDAEGDRWMMAAWREYDPTNRPALESG